MYTIIWTDGTRQDGFISEAEAVRFALEEDDPRAEVYYKDLGDDVMVNNNLLGTAEVLAEELGVS